LFGCAHYVPVLRWRRAEKKALADLGVDCRHVTTPLIEVTPQAFARKSRKTKRLVPRERMAGRIAEELSTHWPDSTLFLDLSVLGSEFKIRKQSPWRSLGPLLADHNSKAVPVSRLPQLADVHLGAMKEFANLDARGLCLRLKEIDFYSPNLIQRIERLLTLLGLSPGRVDLVCDLQCYCDTCRNFTEICTALPHLTEWRTFTIISGDFPKDLGDYEPRLEHLRKRSDWLSWKKQVCSGNLLRRNPAYGDYTIQFGEYQAPIKGARPSGSIRYTLEEKWRILRGEDITKEGGPGRRQYWAWAVLLCERNNEYYGKEFSPGDEYMYQRSLDPANPGTPQSWLYAGINHHLTVAARQIAKLSVP
jgi:hypothetical protein